MQKEAEEHAEEDNKKKEEVDLRNEVDQLIFTTEKTLKEVDGKVPEDEVKKVKDALEDLKKAQKDNNLEDMKAKKDALSKVAQDLAVKLYQQNGGAQGGPQGPNPQGGQPNDNSNGNDDGPTVDGDFHK